MQASLSASVDFTTTGAFRATVHFTSFIAGVVETDLLAAPIFGSCAVSGQPPHRGPRSADGGSVGRAGGDQPIEPQRHRLDHRFGGCGRQLQSGGVHNPGNDTIA